MGHVKHMPLASEPPNEYLEDMSKVKSIIQGDELETFLEMFNEQQALVKILWWIQDTLTTQRDDEAIMLSGANVLDDYGLGLMVGLVTLQMDRVVKLGQHLADRTEQVERAKPHHQRSDLKRESS